jgi:hypothetical protein
MDPHNITRETFYVYVAGIANWSINKDTQLLCSNYNIVRHNIYEQIKTRYLNIVIRYYDPLYNIHRKQTNNNDAQIAINNIQNIVIQKDIAEGYDSMFIQMFLPDDAKFYPTDHVIIDLANVGNICGTNIIRAGYLGNKIVGHIFKQKLLDFSHNDKILTIGDKINLFCDGCSVEAFFDWVAKGDTSSYEQLQNIVSIKREFIKKERDYRQKHNMQPKLKQYDEKKVVELLCDIIWHDNVNKENINFYMERIAHDIFNLTYSNV